MENSSPFCCVPGMACIQLELNQSRMESTAEA